jgi:hypothetical protein
MFHRLTRIIFWSAFVFVFILAGVYWRLGNIYLVVTFPLGALALFILFLISKSGRARRYRSEFFRGTLLGIGGTIFFITTLGTIYFYNGLFGYDVAAHFFITVLFVIMAAMLYELLRSTNSASNAIETIAVSVLTLVIFSFLWEWYEKQGDIWWNTKMFYDPWQEISLDVATDLSANFLGMFAASVLIFKYWDKWNKKWQKSETEKLKNLKT